MATLRLFIAIEISADIRSRIGGVGEELRKEGADVRWETPDNLHITLKFLGKTDEPRVSDILAALETVVRATPQFTLQFSALGCFPHVQQPRIIWVGVQNPDSTLSSLADSVDSALNALGFEKEKRPFHAHVTIGRVGSQHRIRDLLRKMESITFESQPTTISEVTLFKSELKPSGSVYTILSRIPLHQQRA